MAFFKKENGQWNLINLLGTGVATAFFLFIVVLLIFASTREGKNANHTVREIVNQTYYVPTPVDSTVVVNNYNHWIVTPKEFPFNATKLIVLGVVDRE